MRWFIRPTAALPVKLILLAWLLYATVVAALGALMKTAAAAMATMAVLGVFAAVGFPLLLALNISAVAAYACPLAVVPRLWQQPRTRAMNLGLTLALVIGSATAGYVLNAAAVWGIGRVADYNPCAALRAGVTGSAPPSERDCASSTR